MGNIIVSKTRALSSILGLKPVLSTDIETHATYPSQIFHLLESFGKCPVVEQTSNHKECKQSEKWQLSPAQ